MNKIKSLALGLGLMASVGLAAGSAAAQTCGGTYKVKRGDSLSLIADALYKDAGKWSAIYQANIGKIGNSPDRIVVGQSYSMPCIDGMPVGLIGGTPLSNIQTTSVQTVARTGAANPLAPSAELGRALATISLLTADDFAPWTDRDLQNGGLITDVVQAAMAKVSPDFGVYWVNDWSAHLEPLLSNAMLDMGFPWYQPDCAGSQSDNYRCQNFLFSDPMFEILILLFTDKNRPLQFASDADIVGKRLCRPAGYFTHDLDKNGRNWVANGLITLEQPPQVADCFEMLEEGKVDAVALNEFTGRTAIKELGLENKVDIVQSRPLSIEGLHVLVNKAHPSADALLALVNSGLAAIKDSGEYQTIIDTHMSMIWANL